jgi:HEAT repeat protein
MLGQQPGLFGALVALLSSSSSDVQEAASCALGFLADDEDLALRIMREPEALGGLVALLRGNAVNMQQTAAGVIIALFEHAACRRASAAHTAGLAAALVQVLEGSSSSSTSCCFLLKGGTHEYAARALSWLASEPAARPVLGQQQGLVGALVALLSSSSSSDVQEKAAWALGCLAEDEGLALRIVREPGALGGLVALVRGSTGEVQVEAAGAIDSLMWHAACRHACTEHTADLAAALLQVVEGSRRTRSCCLWAQYYAARAISWLAQDPASRQVVRQQPGLVGALVALLSSSSSSSSSSSIALMHAAQHAAFAIANLAQEPGSRALLVQAPHLMGRLVALLSSSSSDHTRLWAAQALHNLAAEEEAVELIPSMQDEAGGLLPLPGCVDYVLEVAAAAVVKLAATAASSSSSSSNSSMALPEGLVASLVQVMGNTRKRASALRRCAVEGVAALSATARLMPVLVQEQGLVSQLVAALSNRSQKMQLAAGRALRNLATDAASAAAMVGMPGVVPGLVALLTSAKGVAASQAALVLCNMMRDAPGCCAAVAQQPGLLPGLRHVMRSESSTYAAVVCAGDAVRALEAGQPLVSGCAERGGGACRHTHCSCVRWFNKVSLP